MSAVHTQQRPDLQALSRADTGLQCLSACKMSVQLSGDWGAILHAWCGLWVHKPFVYHSRRYWLYSQTDEVTSGCNIQLCRLQQGVMSCKISALHHQVCAAVLDPERHACRALHHPVVESEGEIRPISQAMLQLLECHRPVARSGTGRVTASSKPIICTSRQAHCSCRAAFGKFGDRLPPGDGALELVQC